jgi:hypothetical protein
MPTAISTPTVAVGIACPKPMVSLLGYYDRRKLFPNNDDMVPPCPPRLSSTKIKV